MSLVITEFWHLDTQEDCGMQKHKFWAWAAVICMLMAIFTGYRQE